MTRRILCWALLMVVVACSASASMGGRRIVQLDLARQMETLTFVSNYIDRVSALGYDTLQLYLEARVATPTFALPDGESYSLDDMRGLVAHAGARGLTVVPVVSLLGHAALFFREPGQEAYMEQATDRLRLGDGRDTFCLSNPKTRAFLAAYVKDLTEVFTGPYFHAGFDEAWNSGTCDRCHAKEMKDELFAESVLFAHDMLAKLGKRMWMWDDFFPFHPKALTRMPTDIVMCHWCYDDDISDRGTRINFAGRMRADMLERYAQLGFDVIPCAWYSTENLRTFAAYARRHRPFGFLVTQWEEMIENFHGGSYPRVVAASLLMDDPTRYQLEDAFAEACRRTFPSLTPTEALAAARILHAPDDALAVETLRASSLRPDDDGPVAADPLSERALFDDLLMRGEIAGIAGRLARAERELADPRRTADDVNQAKAVLASVLPELARLERRRQAQAAAWRPGCRSCFPRRQVAALQARAQKALDEAAVASADEKWLEVELTLVDRYGVPWWKAFGRFGGEWREIAAGVWKPGAQTHPAFTQRCRFRSETMPEAVRLEQHGFGDAAVRYVSVCDRAMRVIPAAVSATAGDVREAANILTDDYSEARFGTFGFLRQYYDKVQQEQVSSVTIELVGND